MPRAYWTTTPIPMPRFVRRTISRWAAPVPLRTSVEPESSIAASSAWTESCPPVVSTRNDPSTQIYLPVIVFGYGDPRSGTGAAASERCRVPAGTAGVPHRGTVRRTAQAAGAGTAPRRDADPPGRDRRTVAAGHRRADGGQPHPDGVPHRRTGEAGAGRAQAQPGRPALTRPLPDRGGHRDAGAGQGGHPGPRGRHHGRPDRRGAGTAHHPAPAARQGPGPGRAQPARHPATPRALLARGSDPPEPPGAP